MQTLKPSVFSARAAFGGSKAVVGALKGALLGLQAALLVVVLSFAPLQETQAATQKAQAKSAAKKNKAVAANKGVKAPRAPRAAKAAKSGIKSKSKIVNSKAAVRTNKSVKGSKAARVSDVRGPGLRVVKKRNGRKVLVRLAPPPPSFGQLYGLHATADELDLRSSVALVVDQDTDEVLFSKNPKAVLPIASITKLMSAVVVAEAGLDMDEVLTVGPEDVQATIGSKSRLQPGTQLTRNAMLQLSLMASENRAAHVLGRTYPGGMQRFVSAMNAKAQALGMSATRYVEPTGLSPNNQSSAQDLTRLVKAAFVHPVIREQSVSQEMMIPMGPTGERTVQFRNTNGLTRNPEWEIGLQKTGYISAAGRCVVMQAHLAGRKLIMVLLDSAGKYSRMGDAERIRQWLLAPQLVPASALAIPQPR
jgi:serine-type D-Ala-D-Ala endopeptidase (penicillin-binding protein 7)